jgi:plasmid stabilization system protein ParE
LSTLPYELTPAAEADLREIARYTLRQWGVRQQRRYARLLEACFRGIAEGSARSRNFSERYPQVRVTQCQHHYVFYLHPEGEKPRIIALLHERMDLVTRIGERLSLPG